METSTGLVSEARKMRVSVLVLVGVIAVCNNNASAKAVTSETEDEANSVGQSPVEQDPRNDTACETAITKSNTHGGEHILRKKQISPDSGKRHSIIHKKFDKKRKTVSEKPQYEESKMRMVSDRTSFVRKDKYESQEKNRHARGFVNNNWYMPAIRQKKYTYPVIYNDRVKGIMNGNSVANMLNRKDIQKIQELMSVFRASSKEGLESFFSAFDNELKKKLRREESYPVRNVNARSAFINTGDVSCESESMDDAFGAVSPSERSDDSLTTTNESGNRIAPSDVRKRSGESPLNYLKETLPVLVEAAEAILGESMENTGFSGGVGVVPDDGMYSKKLSALGTGDEAVEPVQDYGIDNGKSILWNYGNFHTNPLSAV